MASEGVEFRTPLCIMRGKEKQWQKFEKKSWSHPPIPSEPKITYFNNKTTHKWVPEFDHFFAYTRAFPIWDQRKRICNGVYNPDIRENIFQQEKDKAIPVLVELDYGRPCNKFYDYQENYRRVHATGDFYRARGVMKVVEKEVQ